MMLASIHPPSPLDVAMEPAPPSFSCLSLREEDWEPSLDPMAITHGASGSPRWLALGITLVLASLSLAVLVLVPWRPMRLASGLGRFASTRSVAVDLGFHELDPRGGKDPVRHDLPGGGRGEGQWAPTHAPGAGGMGDLEAIPSLPTLDVKGELSSPVPLPGKTVAMGGGWANTGGFAGGSPQGRGGTGGGNRALGVPTSGMGDLEGRVVSQRKRQMIPIHQVQPQSMVYGWQAVPAAVVVRVQVGMDGRVEGAWVRTGPEHLRSDALAAARQWRFKPLQECGFDTPQKVDLSFEYGPR